MTEPESPIDNVIRLVMKGVKDATGNPEVTSNTDRVLVAITLVGVAIVILWPRDVIAPEPLVKVGRVAGDVWARRAWWLN